MLIFMLLLTTFLGFVMGFVAAAWMAEVTLGSHPGVPSEVSNITDSSEDWNSREAVYAFAASILSDGRFTSPELSRIRNFCDTHDLPATREEWQRHIRVPVHPVFPPQLS